MSINTSVDHPVVKAVSAWALVGITSWADVAAMLASLYTLILISEWFWKKCIRSWLKERGYIK